MKLTALTSVNDDLFVKELHKVEKLREDEIVQGLDIPDVKKMSDEFLDGYFRVPKVLGEGA